MTKRLKFLNTFVDLFNIGQINEIKPGTHVISLNAEQVVLAQDDPEFLEIIRESELIIPDGAGIVKGLKFLNGKHIKDVKKLAGIDLASKLLEIKERIAILGSKPEIIEAIRKNYGKKIVFAHHGYFSEEDIPKIVSDIKDSQAELLLVGMGAPKQEKFIHKYKKEFQEMISMGVGGTLDVLAGYKERAPDLFITLDLEWFYRLVREPFRFKRIFFRVPRFIILLIKEKLRS